MKTGKLFKTTPPALYKWCIGLMVISLALPYGRVISFPLNLAGVGIFIFGVYIAFTAKQLFKRTDTPMNPGARPLNLHVNGLYRYTRNPMYLGIVIGLLGIAILTGIGYNFIFPVVYLWTMDRFFIKAEEQSLEEIFGSAYLEYKKKTRRWI